MKKKKTSMIWMLTVCLLGAALMTAAEAAEDLYRLPVFETADVHGSLASTATDEYEYRLAYIADKVNDARGGDRDRALLLDAGDIFQGSMLSNLLEGNPMAAAYSRMGYDAVTVGNHEFDWGIEATIDGDGTMKDDTRGGEDGVNLVPVVLSNLFQNGDRVTFTKDYVILEKTAVNEAGGTVRVKIGVVGFAQNYAGSIMYTRFTGAGYTLVEDYDALEELAARLEESGMCDATILLTHTDAAEISERIDPDSALDLILGGHSHENRCGEGISGIAYLQPTCDAAAYAYAELLFRCGEDGAPAFAGTDAAKTVSVTAHHASLLRDGRNAGELDEEVARVSDDAIEAIREVLNEKIGSITAPARKPSPSPDDGTIVRDSTCGSWMASIYARAVGAEIGFVNNGGIRVNYEIPAGKDACDITVSSVYAMFPFNNHIYGYEITYEELLELLRYAMTHAGGTLLSVVTGIDVYYTNDAVVELVKDGRTIYEDGTWRIDPASKVRIAVSDYVSTTPRTSDERSGSLENPLCAWKDTDRLYSRGEVDSEAALRVLKEEAAANGGLLRFDSESHYIERPAAESESQPQSETPEEPEAEGPKGFLTYIVKLGDFLWKIASRFYGSGSLFHRIAEANAIADPDLIFAGQTLVIPEA